MELEKQLALGRENEEKYKKIVDQILSGEYVREGSHPFKKVFERCGCKLSTPNNNY